jgi:tetratricopeptide (TPR) repeat protein
VDEADDSLETVIPLALAGGNLSELQAKRLERRLRSVPNNLKIRLKLIGYYFLARFQNDASSRRFQELALWLIVNRPKSKIHSTAFVRFDSSDELHVHAKQAWKQNVEEYQNDSKVLLNAFRFAMISDDFYLAEKLLLEAIALEPDNASISFDLSNLYKQMGEAQQDEIALNRSLKYLQSALEKSDGSSKFNFLTYLPFAAYRANRLQLAEQYAFELIQMSRRFSGEWNFGNALQQAYTVLGLLALSRNDVTTASQYLMASIDVPPTPQLSTFGPELALAQKLLLHGESEAVISFLVHSKRLLIPQPEVDEQMRQFQMPQMIDDWIAAIRNGDVPELWTDPT